MTLNKIGTTKVAHEQLDTALKILEACSEAKAKDLTLLNVETISDIASYFVIVSGRSDRQVQGISNRIAATLDEAGISYMSRDGYDQGHWVLMDYGDIIVHIFYEPVREHYGLERLWSKAEPISIPEEIKVGKRAA